MVQGNATILLAEDEPITRMGSAEALDVAGFTVMEAANGVQAMNLLDDPDHVDVVVTDLKMPLAGGLEVARKVAADHPGVPVIFASTGAGVIETLPQPTQHLPKPYTPEQLTQAVQRALSSAQALSVDPSRDALEQPLAALDAEMIDLKKHIQTLIREGRHQEMPRVHADLHKCLRKRASIVSRASHQARS